MFDIVAPNKHQLSLPVETEGIHQAQSRLSRPHARHAQPMREHKAVNDSQHHQRGNPAGRQQSDLNDTIVAERKIT
jgi:hypothetical protein